MRRIKKGACPASLLKPTVQQEVAQMIQEFQNGKTEFKIKSGIYGSKSVKSALIRDQKGKCAFCESVVYVKTGRKWEIVGQYGDVEHFRPKGNVKESGRKEIGADGRERTVYDHPGYFWLAYEWSNLSFSCQICNQAYKRDHFPVENGTNWAMPNNGLTDEKPLMIDPHEDPAPHFIFDREAVQAVTERGAAAILRCGLDRPGLMEMRRRVIDQVRFFLEMAAEAESVAAEVPEPAAERLREQIRRADALAQEACKAEKPYSTCLRAFVASQGRHDLVGAAGPA